VRTLTQPWVTTADRVRRRSAAHRRAWRRDYGRPEGRLYGIAIGASVLAHFLFAGLLIVSDLAPSRPRRTEPIRLATGFSIELTQVRLARTEAPEEIGKPKEPEKVTKNGHVPVPKQPKVKVAERKPEPAKPKTTPGVVTPKTKEPPSVNAAKPSATRPVRPLPDAKPGTENTRPGLSGPARDVELDVSFPFAAYTNQIAQKLHRLWVPAPGVPEGTDTVVLFEITRDGRVSGIGIETSSGSPAYDASALSAVRAVGSFSPLPEGFPGERLNVRFHFKYRRG
jgi:TonB family protein